MWLEFWRNLAAVWLVLLCFFALLVPLVVLFFTVRGMNWVNVRVPGLMQKAQSETAKVRNKADEMSGKVAEPVLRAQERGAKMEQTVKSLFRRGPLRD